MTPAKNDDTCGQTMTPKMQLYSREGHEKEPEQVPGNQAC
jgi:hypothetical protein